MQKRVAYACLAWSGLLAGVVDAAAQTNARRADPVGVAIGQRAAPGATALPVPAPSTVSSTPAPGNRHIQWNDQFGGAPSGISTSAINAARAVPQSFDLGGGMQVVPGIGGVRIVGPDGPDSAGLRIGSTASGNGVAVGIGIPTTVFGR